jgi:predicted nucleic acid-binding protein
MTRYVLDAGAVLRVTAADAEPVDPDHDLLAPTLVRSQTLSRLHEAVARGELDREAALAQHERIGRLRLRLLGDAVLRRVAWKLADELGWPETYTAEYLALTRLQADAFVTDDPELARAAATVVAVATIEDLAARRAPRHR